MTEEEYKSWVTPFLEQTPEIPQKLFFEMLELADNLRRPNFLLSHHMESSFNSHDRLNIIKATHIFRYPDFQGEKCAKDFINQEILINFIKKLNRVFKTNFNLEALRFVLSVPLSQGGKNDGLVFYADFNRATNQFDKVSFHFNPSQSQWISQIAQFLKIKETIKEIPNLEFIGMDFYPNERCELKFYQEVKNPTKLDQETRNLLSQLTNFKPVQTILLMKRLNSSEMREKRNIYFCCGDLNYGQLFKLPLLESHKDFLKLINPFVNNVAINWIIFKDDKLELYFK